MSEEDFTYDESVIERLRKRKDEDWTEDELDEWKDYVDKINGKIIYGEIVSQKEFGDLLENDDFYTIDENEEKTVKCECGNSYEAHLLIRKEVPSDDSVYNSVVLIKKDKDKTTVELRREKRIEENRIEAERFGSCPYCGTSWENFNIFPAFWVCGVCDFQRTVWVGGTIEDQILANSVAAFSGFIRGVGNHLKQDPKMNLDYIRERIHKARFYLQSLDLQKFYDVYSIKSSRHKKEGGVYINWIKKQYLEWEEKGEFKKEVYKEDE